MNPFFDKINIESIQFESGINEVNVSCKIEQGGIVYHSELILSFSDLNRLIGRIEQLSKEYSLLENFKEINMYEGHSLYLLKTQNTDLENLWIDKLDFREPLKQIRA
jgi:hypothetical protein